MNKKVPHKALILMTVTVLSTVTVFLLPAIPQDVCYHDFADNRTLFGIPNFFNVLSNVTFLPVSIFGLYVVRRNVQMQTCDLVFFIAVLCTAFGSGYYHWHPNNQSLFWDRLPMAIGFMAFLSAIISRNINESFGKHLLWHFITLGVLSVCYWYQTETTGKGDLRLYALVQFLPMILIPLIAFMYQQPRKQWYLLWMLLAYAMAKFLEHYDHRVFYITRFVSGHTLKHLSASLAPFLYALFLNRENVRSLSN